MEPENLTSAHIALQLFPGYSEAETAIFRDFKDPEAKPEPGFIVDFLGCRIRTTSVWTHARAYDGQLVGIPVPADFHAEAVEWLGLLKAVSSAREKYVAMELGAGFGPWSIAGGRAARSRDIENIRLYAVEADPHHFRFLGQHFIDNGFDPEQHALIEAAVGTTAGIAEWPVFSGSDAAEEWGSRPIMSDVDYPGHSAESVTKINVVSMLELIKRESEWDLIHIDVQGAELDICRSCIDELNVRVRWITVATHSRKIDGDMIELMYRAGWVMENEKPAKFRCAANPSTLEDMTALDGTQVWRNPRLASPGYSLGTFSQQITSSFSNMHVSAAESFDVAIRVENNGMETWLSATDFGPVNASYRWVDSVGNELPIEGKRTSLGQPALSPGESVLLTLEVLAPPAAGCYRLLISMVQEGVAWFYGRGGQSLVLEVEVS